MKKIFFSIAAVLVSSQLFAQSAFEGFYGQVATGYESNNFSSISIPWSEPEEGSGGGSASNQSSSGAPLLLGVGYNHSLTDKYLVGVGIDYSAISQSTGNFSWKATLNGVMPVTSLNSVSYKVANRLNIFVTPSYVLSANSLIYLKAGYSSEQLQYSQGADSALYFTNSSTASKNINGYILGLGYKQMIAQGFYGFAEGNYMAYGNSTLSVTNATVGASPTTTSPSQSVSAYNFLVGIGYKF
ncbi:outer membrane beta-barrel protein [Polynucleobacter paneuropaeus]|nr:outer membrane beta-barrel protein [Polynucleobacter paneuropaeus]MBT8601151.1 outer membrane beta-barrel protein [Polynucleobacter paneuropaeus]